MGAHNLKSIALDIIASDFNRCLGDTVTLIGERAESLPIRNARFKLLVQVILLKEYPYDSLVIAYGDKYGNDTLASEMVYG